jgi:hypothetical protein
MVGIAVRAVFRVLETEFAVDVRCVYPVVRTQPVTTCHTGFEMVITGQITAAIAVFRVWRTKLATSSGAFS